MEQWRAWVLVVLGLGLGFVLFGQGAAQQGEDRPQAVEVAVGTGFTYQGQLEVANGAANGAYDFQFRLYDAATDGVQIGGTVTEGNVQVEDGLFSVLLDFGDAPFAGEARWLEIAVRDGNSTGAYTTLAPRQQFSATPYALYALGAGSVAWENVENKPVGVVEGYENVVVVAKSGGDYTSVQAALDSITDAAADNAYLVYVAPGVYEGRVVMKPFVTVEGAGQEVTVIRWVGGSQAPWEGDGSATVVGASDAALRELTVENDGTGESFAVGVLSIGSVRMTVRDVTARAWDATDNRAVASFSGAEVLLKDVTAQAWGGQHAHGVTGDSSTLVMRDLFATARDADYTYGVLNWHTGSPTMQNVSAVASNASFTNRAIYNNGSSPNINGGIVRAFGGQSNIGIHNLNNSAAVVQGVRILATGGNNTYGVLNYQSAAWLMELTISAAGGSAANRGVMSDESASVINNVTAATFGSGAVNFGVDVDGGTPELTNVWATASSGSSNYGLRVVSADVEVRHSKFEGSTNSITQAGGQTNVAYSQLIGPLTYDAGLGCLGNYDADLNAVSCP